MDIVRSLADLASERPVFSGEADFQHALAWQLHLQDPSAKIRLEHRPSSTRMYLDIVVESDNKRTAIELKYKTRKLDTTVNGETFRLADQGAQDCGKYDVLKDIERLEKIVGGEQFHEGYMVFLTNDPHYFASHEGEKETIDQQFRLTEGRVLTGELKWSEAAGPGTTKGREEPIRFSGQYVVNWKPYSKIDAPYGEFRMLIVRVRPLDQTDRIPDFPSVLLATPEYEMEHDGEPAGMDSAILELAARRPIFRSQIDLRDALAGVLSDLGWNVTRNREMGQGLKVDIWAERAGRAGMAIEVRYKTSRLTCTMNGETFGLKNQAAQDVSRYDYLHDVEKLEQIVSSRPGTHGYAVMITNEHLYWDKPTKSQSVDEDFLLFDGRIVSGTLKWSENAGKGTVDGREKPIHLRDAYTLQWRDYSNPSTDKNGVFKALVLDVKKR
jgi:hypothetical protein